MFNFNTPHKFPITSIIYMKVIAELFTTSTIKPAASISFERVKNFIFISIRDSYSKHEIQFD
ncbi:hypothetical protein Hanom_Chr12g01118311 [Helianthus anomalus]